MPERCEARRPRTGERCEYDAGHDGPHGAGPQEVAGYHFTGLPGDPWTEWHDDNPNRLKDQT